MTWPLRLLRSQAGGHFLWLRRMCLRCPRGHGTDGLLPRPPCAWWGAATTARSPRAEGAAWGKHQEGCLEAGLCGIRRARGPHSLGCSSARVSQPKGTSLFKEAVARNPSPVSGTQGRLPDCLGGEAARRPSPWGCRPLSTCLESSCGDTGMFETECSGPGGWDRWPLPEVAVAGVAGS